MIWSIAAWVIKPRVAREQGVGDDPHGGLGGNARHVAHPGFEPGGVGGAGEDRHQGVDRGGGEIGGDDPALLAPELAVGGEQPAPDRAAEQFLDDIGLLIIAGIVEQHPLDHLGVERDQHIVAQHLAPDVRRLERCSDQP